MSFATNLRLDKRFVSWIAIAALVVASLLPALLTTVPASAAQMGDRSIALDDSSNGHADTNYTVSFRVNQGVETAGVVIDFCSNSPIIGDSCSEVAGTVPDISNIETAGVATSITSETGNIVNATINAATDANTLILEFDSVTPAGNELFTFVMGDGDTNRANDNSNGVTNPTTANTSFYARIVTYNTAQAPESYASATPGTHLDDGGIAMSTANELTITARVQEVLEFCVGNADAASAEDCTDISGTTIDMGVLDASNITESSDRYPAGESHGYLMMRTNGLNGLNLSYLGGLLTSGGNTINAIGATESALTTNAEGFGIDVVDVDDNTETASTVDESNGGGTTTLNLDPDWDTFNQWTYAGSATVADTIATSTSVLDDVMLILDFGGTVDNLVPTGLYTTTITFIATGLF